MNKILELNDFTLPIIEKVAEQMPGGFFIYHADGNEEFILINKAMIRITGCENEIEFRELTKNSFKNFVHPDDIDSVEMTIEKQIKNSEYDNDYVEYRIVCKNGQIKWIKDYGHFTHTNTLGDVFYVFVDDATEKHEQELALQIALEEQEAQLQEITALNEELKEALNTLKTIKQ